MVVLVAVVLPRGPVYSPPPWPVAVLPLTVQLVSVVVPYTLPPKLKPEVRTPAPFVAVLLLIVVLVAAVVPPPLDRPPPELPLTVQLVRVVTQAEEPKTCGSVATPSPELPLTVQLVRVVVPLFDTPPPPP